MKRYIVSALLILALSTAAEAQVIIECATYAPNPGSIKGEVRLANPTMGKYKVKVKRGNNPAQEHVIDAHQKVVLGYLVFGDLPCNHKFSIVSQTPTN